MLEALTSLSITRIMLASAVCCLFSTAVADETVRITNGEWPPYLSEHLKHYGVASRIVTEAFAQEGVQVEYGFFPWARALNEVKIGTWDAGAVWFRSPERDIDFIISDPVVDVQYVLFHLKSKPIDWDTLEDLKQYTIGATLVYDYGEQFQKAEEAGEIKVERVPSDEQNFKKLLAGRIDVFPLDIEVGYSMLKDTFTPEQIALLTHHPKPIRTASLHLLLSRKVEENEARAEVFNRGLKTLRDGGQIEQYLEESRRGEYIIVQ